MANQKKKILVLYSNTNVKGKKDATGAFIPEAKAFSKVHKVSEEDVVGIRMPRVAKEKRREKTILAILNAKKRLGSLDAVAFFGHGWAAGIQFGFNRKNINELTECLSECCAKSAKIILYACLAAENDVRDKNETNIGPGTDGGFADVLRDKLVVAGFGDHAHVDAHKTAGHTTWNPYVVRFQCEESTDLEYDAIGGGWLVAPRSQHWKAWIKALRKNTENIRYSFPFMTEQAVHNFLSSL